MALTPSLKFIKNNGSYFPVDTTGIYDVDVNEGGFGTPNAARTDITRIVISLTAPDGTVTTYDTDDSTLTLAKLTGAPTTSYNVILAKKSITFIDGAYSLEYTLYVGATEYTYEDTWFYLEDSKCCIYKEFAAVVRKADCVKIESLKEVLTNWAVYKAIQFNAAGGTTAEATYLLTKLQKWCNNTC